MEKEDLYIRARINHLGRPRTKVFVNLLSSIKHTTSLNFREFSE